MSREESGAGPSAEQEVVVNRFTRELSKFLKEKFGARGEGLGQLVNSVEGVLPKTLSRTIRGLARSRNRVVKEGEPLVHPKRFVEDCEAAITDLQTYFRLLSASANPRPDDAEPDSRIDGADPQCCTCRECGISNRDMGTDGIWACTHLELELHRTDREADPDLHAVVVVNYGRKSVRLKSGAVWATSSVGIAELFLNDEGDAAQITHQRRREVEVAPAEAKSIGTFRFRIPDVLRPPRNAVWREHWPEFPRVVVVTKADRVTARSLREMVRSGS